MYLFRSIFLNSIDLKKSFVEKIWSSEAKIFEGIFKDDERIFVILTELVKNATVLPFHPYEHIFNELLSLIILSSVSIKMVL